MLIYTDCQYILVPCLLPTTTSAFCSVSMFQYYSLLVCIVNIGISNVLNKLFTAGLCTYSLLTITVWSRVTESKWKWIGRWDLINGRSGRASLTIGWQGGAFWLKEGKKDGGQNLELELKFQIEQKHRPALERDTQNTRMSKSLSESMNHRLSNSSEHDPGLVHDYEPEVLASEPNDGSKVSNVSTRLGLVQPSPVQEIFGPGSDQSKFPLDWYGLGLDQSTRMELARCY
jgi:hypothetical protein